MGKHHVIGLGILDAIKHILTSDQVRNNELKYWTLMVLYQISRCGTFISTDAGTQIYTHVRPFSESVN